MAERKLTRVLTDRICQLAHWVGHPYMIAALGLFTGVWFVTEKANIGWDGFLAVFTMVATIVIQASQNRDTAAIHAKLDELLRVNEDARDDLRHVEELPEKEINNLRD